MCNSVTHTFYIYRVTVLHTNKVSIMKTLDFNNQLYYLLMDHADVLDETDGQRLAGCSVDQMFDDLYGLQDDAEPMQMTTKRGTYNDK